MEKIFEDIHSSYKNELGGVPLTIEDSDAVKEARDKAISSEGFVNLGKALSKQLRYKDAIMSYSRAIELDESNYEAYRLRGGRYLTTLSLDRANVDLKWCLEKKGENTDVLYLLALSAFYGESYETARDYFESALKYSDEEMGVAIIYWHTIASIRSQKEMSLLLKNYHKKMKIGHHTAYNNVLKLFAGYLKEKELLLKIDGEKSDLEYSMAMYGLSNYYYLHGNREQAKKCLRKVLSRDGFWISFAFIGAWNDENRRFF